MVLSFANQNGFCCHLGTFQISKDSGFSAVKVCSSGYNLVYFNNFLLSVATTNRYRYWIAHQLITSTVSGTNSTAVCLKINKQISYEYIIKNRELFPVIKCIKVMDCVPGVSKTSKFYAALKDFIMNRERTLGSIDQYLQHGISHSNTRINVSLEVLTDDDNNASKQSS